LRAGPGGQAGAAATPPRRGGRQRTCSGRHPSIRWTEACAWRPRVAHGQGVWWRGRRISDVAPPPAGRSCCCREEVSSRSNRRVGVPRRLPPAARDRSSVPAVRDLQQSVETRRRGEPEFHATRAASVDGGRPSETGHPPTRHEPRGVAESVPGSFTSTGLVLRFISMGRARPPRSPPRRPSAHPPPAPAPAARGHARRAQSRGRCGARWMPPRRSFRTRTTSA